MDERELIKKINKLKHIKPDDNWKNNYRQVLFSQISSGQLSESENHKFGWKVFLGDLLPRNIMMKLSGPVAVISLLLITLISGGLASVYASRDSKPGDSLYIAKIISEKAQLAITFDDKEKAKLGIEFASNRAKEISQVLGETESDNRGKGDKIEKLAQSFKNEINQVKNHLEKINLKNNSGVNENDETAQVFGANIGKDDKGMEISEPKKEETAVNNAEATTTPLKDENLSAATSTSKATANEEFIATNKILEEAEKLFDEENYIGTIDKLKQVNQVINQTAEKPESGQVKGENETATSTN